MTNFLSLSLLFYLSLSTPTTVLPPTSDSNQLSLSNDTPGVFVSDWENATGWETAKSQEAVQYAYKRILPGFQLQALKESQLIVYVRGYQFKDSVVAEKPLSLPFCFFMPEEKAFKPLYWNYSASSGQLEITLQVPLDVDEKFSQTKEKVQFRYFVVDKAFLKKQKLSTGDVRNLSYRQMIQLTNKTP